MRRQDQANDKGSHCDVVKQMHIMELMRRFLILLTLNAVCIDAETSTFFRQRDNGTNKKSFLRHQERNIERLRELESIPQDDLSENAQYRVGYFEQYIHTHDTKVIKEDEREQKFSFALAEGTGSDQIKIQHETPMNSLLNLTVVAATTGGVQKSIDAFDLEPTTLGQEPTPTGGNDNPPALAPSNLVDDDKEEVEELEDLDNGTDLIATINPTHLPQEPAQETNDDNESDDESVEGTSTKKSSNIMRHKFPKYKKKQRKMEKRQKGYKYKFKLPEDYNEYYDDEMYEEIDEDIPLPPPKGSYLSTKSPKKGGPKEKDSKGKTGKYEGEDPSTKFPKGKNPSLNDDDSMYIPKTKYPRGDEYMDDEFVISSKVPSSSNKVVTPATSPPTDDEDKNGKSTDGFVGNSNELQLSVAVFEYDLLTSAGIADSDYKDLQNVTQIAFDDMYSTYFAGVDKVSYLKTIVEQYSVIAPRLVQFRVKLQFSPNSETIPSVEQVEIIAQEGFAYGGDAYNLYLQLIQGLVTSVFATTTSVKYIDDVELLKTMESQSDFGASAEEGSYSSFKLILPIASLAGVFIIVTAVCIRRQSNLIIHDQYNPCSDEFTKDKDGVFFGHADDARSIESTHVSEYRTSVFSDDGIEQYRDIDEDASMTMTPEGRSDRDSTPIHINSDSNKYEFDDISLEGDSECMTHAEDTGSRTGYITETRLEVTQTQTSLETNSYAELNPSYDGEDELSRNSDVVSHLSTTLRYRNGFYTHPTIDEETESSYITSDDDSTSSKNDDDEAATKFASSAQALLSVSVSESQPEEEFEGLQEGRQTDAMVASDSPSLQKEVVSTALTCKPQTNAMMSSDTALPSTEETGTTTADSQSSWMLKKLRPVSDPKPRIVETLTKHFEKTKAEAKVVQRSRFIPPKKTESVTNDQQPEWISKPLRSTGIVLAQEKNSKLVVKLEKPRAPVTYSQAIMDSKLTCSSSDLIQVETLKRVGSQCIPNSKEKTPQIVPPMTPSNTVGIPSVDTKEVINHFETESLSSSSETSGSGPLYSKVIADFKTQSQNRQNMSIEVKSPIEASIKSEILVRKSTSNSSLPEMESVLDLNATNVRNTETVPEVTVLKETGSVSEIMKLFQSRHDKPTYACSGGNQTKKESVQAITEPATEVAQSETPGSGQIDQNARPKTSLSSDLHFEKPIESSPPNSASSTNHPAQLPPTLSVSAMAKLFSTGLEGLPKVQDKYKSLKADESDQISGDARIAWEVTRTMPSNEIETVTPMELQVQNNQDAAQEDIDAYNLKTQSQANTYDGSVSVSGKLRNNLTSESSRFESKTEPSIAAYQGIPAADSAATDLKMESSIKLFSETRVSQPKTERNKCDLDPRFVNEVEPDLKQFSAETDKTPSVCVPSVKESQNIPYLSNNFSKVKTINVKDREMDSAEAGRRDDVAPTLAANPTFTSIQQDEEMFVAPSVTVPVRSNENTIVIPETNTTLAPEGDSFDFASVRARVDSVFNVRPTELKAKAQVKKTSQQPCLEVTDKETLQAERNNLFPAVTTEVEHIPSPSTKLPQVEVCEGIKPGRENGFEREVLLGIQTSTAETQPTTKTELSRMRNSLTLPSISEPNSLKSYDSQMCATGGVSEVPSWMKKIPPSVSAQLPQNTVDIIDGAKPLWLKKSQVTVPSSSLQPQELHSTSISDNKLASTPDDGGGTGSETPVWMKKFKLSALEKKI